MTKDEYEDFALRYKGCGACFPMYHTLSRFEKMWFSAIQKDVADLEKENKILAQNLEDTEIINKALEKENAELKTKKIPQLERRIASIRGSHSVDAKKLNARIEQVERLKKENAELKEQCSILADCNTCTSACKTENIEMKNNLTKAKEIIKDLLGSENTSCEEEMFFEIRQKAEQFISEVEK